MLSCHGNNGVDNNEQVAIKVTSYGLKFRLYKAADGNNKPSLATNTAFLPVDKVKFLKC